MFMIAIYTKLANKVDAVNAGWASQFRICGRHTFTLSGCMGLLGAAELWLLLRFRRQLNRPNEPASPG